MRWRSVAFLLGVLALPLASGCGGGVAAVSGKVTQKNGSSPEGAKVVFTDEKNSLSAMGNVDANGNYVLTTKKVGDGAPPGKYVVTFYPPSAKDSSQLPPPRTFHEKYSNPSTSGFEREVKSGSNQFDFELDPP